MRFLIIHSTSVIPMRFLIIHSTSVISMIPFTVNNVADTPIPNALQVRYQYSIYQDMFIALWE